MVDTELRAQLAMDIQRLVTGQMPCREFDDRYHNTYSLSQDRAVLEIADEGLDLCEGDLLFSPVRLDPNQLDPELRQAADRIVLFLGTDNDYPFPPDDPMPSFAKSVVGFLGACAVTFGAAALAIASGSPVVPLPPVVVIVLGFIALGMFLKWESIVPKGWRSVDFGHWPFRDKESWMEAKAKFAIARKEA